MGLLETGFFFLSKFGGGRGIFQGREDDKEGEDDKEEGPEEEEEDVDGDDDDVEGRKIPKPGGNRGMGLTEG